MLTITIIALVLAIPLSSISSASNESSGVGTRISATLYTRIVAIALIFAALLSYNALPSFSNTDSYDSALDAGVGLYSGLIHASSVTQMIEVFLFVSAALILLPWSSSTTAKSITVPSIPEYPLIIIFTTLGATFLLASADLVSMYLSIELQSFGVYILAALYRDSESATAAGLKYFLLGALSSALILLGSALVYGYTGLTNLDSIYELISVPSALTENTSSLQGIVLLGFILISVGLLFKVASAPFHYWAPDVYDGTPTIVTTWLTVMPKISLFIFLLELSRGSIAAFSSVDISSDLVSQAIGIETNIITNLLLVCAFLSLVIGTVVGLGQYRIKRLFAYSTISHVGFLLLALASLNGNATAFFNSDESIAGTIGGQESVESFLFYIMQYSLTNINLFFVLLAFGYFMNMSPNANTRMEHSNDIQFTSELQGQFQSNPILGLSFAICLFSIAGVPPLVGFFGKYTVLSSAIHNGYLFLAIVAILASVVSAVYYLRIIRVIHFSGLPGNTNQGIVDSNPSIPSFGRVDNILSTLASTNSTSNSPVTSVHSYVIASLTLFILLFAVNPTLILNSTTIMALSLYVT